MFSKIPVILLHKLEDLDASNKKSNVEAAAYLNDDTYRKAISDTDKGSIGSNDVEKMLTKVPVVLLHRLEDLDVSNKKSNAEAAAYLGDDKYRKANSDTNEGFVGCSLSDFEYTDILQLNSIISQVITCSERENFDLLSKPDKVLEVRPHDVKSTKNTVPTESSDFDYIDALKAIADPRDNTYLSFTKITDDLDYFKL